MIPPENQTTEHKSLKMVTGKSADFTGLAEECVAFANAKGGTVYIGVEDGEALPPQGQTIDPNLPAKITKRISELCVNVGVLVETETAENGGEYISLKVFPSSQSIASTTSGKYFYRIVDACRPLLPDELARLFIDKPSFVWETKVARTVTPQAVDAQKRQDFIDSVNASQRISAFVKEKTFAELLDYYLMAEGASLTNLGVLWLGSRGDRARLSYAPVIQFLKYDELGNRVRKQVWDDFELNPKEMIQAVWEQIPEWKEGIEVSDGMFRKFIPNYEEPVIRELLTNALVHKPYRDCEKADFEGGSRFFLEPHQ
jgi:ATP-dependent DNA helicase RecG